VYPGSMVKYLYGVLEIVVLCAKRELEFYTTCGLCALDMRGLQGFG